MFQFAEPGTRPDLKSHFVTGGAYIPRVMCFLGRNLVMHAFHGERGTYETKMYDETGHLLQEWEPCHVSPSMTEFELQGQQYLLEGCTICRVIRKYEFPQNESKIICRHIFPSLMCKGPNGTVFVFDDVQNSIKRLDYRDGRLHFTDKFSSEIVDIRGLCFSDKLGFVMLLHSDRKTITGVDMVTGKVAIQFSSSSEVQFDFKDIFLTLPDGRVFVFMSNEIFTLDPTDGTILRKLLELNEPGTIWAAATSQNGNHQKLAIAQMNRISIYEIPFQSFDACGYFALQDITYDDDKNSAVHP